MAGTIQCDVCGGLFHPRHIRSHQRLAHGKEAAKPSAVPRTVEEAIQQIQVVLSQLSAEEQARVLAHLNKECSRAL